MNEIKTGFPYSLAHIPVDPVDETTGKFTVSKPFILLDSVVVTGPALAPFNNLPLSVSDNPIMRVVDFVDLSAYLSNPGTHLYTRLTTLEDVESGKVQYVIVLLKNF